MNKYAQTFPYFDTTALLVKLSYYIQYYVQPLAQLYMVWHVIQTQTSYTDAGNNYEVKAMQLPIPYPVTILPLLWCK